jgi:hypothetical protein
MGKWGTPMVNNPVWEICEHVAEVQVPLDEMFDVGYFPPNTPQLPGTPASR